jgi:hypothetical protein
MTPNLHGLGTASVLLMAASAVAPAFGQKSGGILSVNQYDSPPSLSSQTSSKRQPLYWLLTIVVSPLTCGRQQVAPMAYQIIGLAPSCCNF